MCQDSELGFVSDLGLTDASSYLLFELTAAEAGRLISLQCSVIAVSSQRRGFQFVILFGDCVNVCVCFLSLAILECLLSVLSHPSF